MTINISFGGATIRRPGANAIVDTANMVPVTTGSLRGLAVIGGLDESATLAPGRVYAFSDPSEARKSLKQGEVLEVMNVLWQHGADLVYVSGVNKAVAATHTLKDSTVDTAVDVLKLTAKDYGTTGNAIKVQVTAAELIVTKGEGVTETYMLSTKTIAELAAEINANKKSIVKAEALAVGTLPLAVSAATNFTGGGAGTATTDSDWDDAIGLLESEFVDGILPVTTAAAIQAKVDTHVAAMSTVLNRRRRRAFYGHAVGASVTDVKEAAASLAGERGLLATPCPLIADSDGNKVAKPSYYMAAAVAGVWAGQAPQEPVTYKNVKFSGLEVQYKATEIVELLDAHVCVVEVVKNGGYRIVQGVTTSPSADLTQSELSVSTLKDFMSNSLETYFEKKYVGQAGVAGIEVTMYNDLVSMLEQFKLDGWISGYVSDSVKVTKTGTAFTLVWQGTPTLPINNFLITTNLTL